MIGTEEENWRIDAFFQADIIGLESQAWGISRQIIHEKFAAP